MRYGNDAYPIARVSAQGAFGFMEGLRLLLPFSVAWLSSPLGGIAYMSKFHERSLTYGAVHFLATLVLGFMLIAGAASGLSDAPQSEPTGLDLVICLAFILQAPVVLIQWAAMKMSPSGSAGLDMSTLCLIAMFSSLGYGYLIAFLVKNLRKARNMMPDTTLKLLSRHRGTDYRPHESYLVR